jgi:glycosyltransferase involved in cell wall biosynthesis
MKLALVVNTFPALSETFIYNKAVALRRAGLDVTIVAATPPDDTSMLGDYDGPVEHMIVSPKISRMARLTAARLLRLSKRDRDLWKAAQERYEFRRAMRAWLFALPFAKFDIVHLEYSGLAVAYLDALAILGRTRLVVSCRGTAERMTPHTDPSRAEQLREMFSVVDRVHCVSWDMLHTCEAYGLDPAKAFVNHPAIDVQRFRRSVPYVARSRGPYKLVSTGRLHWAKGLEFGLLAVRALVDRGHDVRYEIIGAGPEEGRVRFAIHDLRLADQVTLAGRKSSADVHTALETADVYVLSSVSEGVSNAALEAMAMEVPIVTTNAGGMAEAVTDGVDGVVVPTRAPDKMADAIETLLADPAKRLELGRAGRRRVEREFSIEHQIAKFVAEYERLCAPSSRS